MAILKTPPSKVRCPNCGSRNVKVDYKTLETSKATWVRKRMIECNECGYKR